jgi:hypothetical protein
MACSRQIRNALNATATAEGPNARGATAGVGSARRASLSGRKRRALFTVRQPLCTTHRGNFAGALQAQGAAPRIPLSLWRRPLSPVVDRDTKASRLELTARLPGGTTVAEGAQSRGELGCPQPTCPRHLNHCARGAASVETPKGSAKKNLRHRAASSCASCGGSGELLLKQAGAA